MIFAERLPDRIERHVGDVVGQCPCQKTFERDVIHPFDVSFGVDVLGLEPALGQQIANRSRNRLELVARGRRTDRSDMIEREMPLVQAAATAGQLRAANTETGEKMVIRHYCPLHRTSVSARTCALSTRRSIVNGYTVAYATLGASDWAMFAANANAGGLVVLPASRPLRSMKFIFQTTRAKLPTISSGATVRPAPASSHCTPVTLKTVEKNFAPASNPTAAKNSATPKSRNAMLALVGM